MRQQDFINRHQQQWQLLEEILRSLEHKPLRQQSGHPQAGQLPRLYRQVCNHYALALGRSYSPNLVEKLHGLMMRGHQQVYSHRSAWLWALLGFIAVDFPRTLRQQRNYFLLALALFLLPALVVGGLCALDDTFVYSLMGDTQVARMEAMYDPGNDRIGRAKDRAADSDFMMFGFYIYNNIGIGFRTFAMGILAGIGTVAALVFNGLMIGGVAGHLSGIGYGQTFWPFVSGHSALELTAIVICGAAGLLLGRAILAPGQLSVADALKVRARPALRLAMGAALMLLAAAFVEAFWSSAPLPAWLKYSVSGTLWLLVVSYFVWAGRGSNGSE